MNDRSAHSGLGIASLVLGLLGAAFEGIMIAAAVLEEKGGGGNAVNAIVAVMSFGLLLNLTGIGIGAASLFQRNVKTLPGILGVIVNASVLFTMAVVLGLLLSGRFVAGPTPAPPPPAAAQGDAS